MFLFISFYVLLSRVNVASAVNILSSTSTSFGGAQQIDEKLQKQLLEEEENAMKQFNKVSNRFKLVIVKTVTQLLEYEKVNSSILHYPRNLKLSKELGVSYR